MCKQEEVNNSESLKIVDYKDVIEETSVKEIEKHFYKIDRFRVKVLETIINTLDLLSKKEIGDPIALNILFDLKQSVKKKIAVIEADIPEIADIEFVLQGTLESGGTILISKGVENHNKIQRNRDKVIENWKKKLKNNLSLSLGMLLSDIENLISKVKTFSEFPDKREWYPQLEKPSANKTTGIHQENETWVIQTYQRVRPDYNSDNKAIQRVKKLYWEEFDLKIGDNTIRRYNGLID